MSTKRRKFQQGGFDWSYRGEQWVTPWCGTMTLARWQEGESWWVARHITGREINRVEGLTFAESQVLIERWLATSQEEPEIDAFVKEYEMRKMAKLL